MRELSKAIFHRIFVHSWMLFFLLMNFHNALGETLTAGETLFITGYAEFLNKNYAVAADAFYSVVQLDNELSDRARPYLSACQYKLGMREIAAYHLNQVDLVDLPHTDRVLFTQLGRLLERELDELNRVRLIVLPYYGGSSFTAEASKKSALFYGTYVGVLYQGWTFSLNAERLNIEFSNGAPSYSQTQITPGISKDFGAAGFFHLNSAIMMASVQGYDAGKVIGGGYRIPLSSEDRIAVDYYQSIYPSLLPSEVRAHQVNLSYARPVLKRPTFSLWSEFRVQSIFSQTGSRTDPRTGFYLKENYNRFVLSLDFLSSSLRLGIGGWLGREALGVRNDGIVVFSTLEEHRWGGSFTLGIPLSQELSITGSLMQEGYVVNGPNLKSQTIYGGVSASF